ncbi:pentapeptide repeat-containing protein [Kribbella sp. CA-293567]|uniref:pentapeptide repeat-containing protein n=1 Tax=Kribbella sp. CA-293567 TaxID=3002436 RepID=UPI0022DE24E8|nr:pentapeptide repeat-containing protein [Kribbella sp. CA-293567]WBQ06733.1 pentapeptide repeat-containing protein [Kribbella sp. CA-293567]
MPPRKPAAKIATPRLRTQLDDRALTADEVDDEDRLTDLALTDQDLGGLLAEHVEFSGCRLNRVNLGGSDLDKLILVDLELDHCDLANARWADASGTRLAITSSRLTGFAGPGVNLQHVTVRDSVLDFSSFRFAKFVKVEFTDCRLQSADFVSADLSGTIFRRCDLTGVEFSQVTATGAVFVDCTWDGTRGIGSLAGATIANSSPIDTLAVTAAMSTALGITLGDPDDHAGS